MNDENKVLLVSFSNNADHQQILFGLCNGLSKHCDVSTISIMNPKVKDAPCGKKNYYVDCPDRPGITKKTFRLDKLLKVVDIIKKSKAEIVYFESLHLWNVFIMLICHNITYVQGVHDVIPHDNSRAIELCTKIACKLADYILIHNQKYKEHLSVDYGVPKDRVYSIELAKAFPKEEYNNKTGTFLCFGRIRRYKGLDALYEIVQRTPLVKYVVAGEPDVDSMLIVDKLKSLENVTVIDREVTENEMQQLFIDADWILLPYASATQSGVVVDAYVHSRPVIAFDVGAISEQVANNESGFLVEKDNIDKFAEMINYASNMSENELNLLSHKAYLYGKSKYSIEAVSKKYNEMFDDISMRKI